MKVTTATARVASLLVVVALGGCGSGDRSSTPPASSGEADVELPEIRPLDASKSTSARFSGTEIFTFDGTHDVTTVEGAFDWRTLTGWASQESSVFSMELIQIGDRCYRREDQDPWRESAADDVDGLCDAALLSNPATEFQLISMTADGEMTVVGDDQIDGSDVTHYRGSWSLHDDSSQVDYWIDEDGIVRRSQTLDKEGGYEAERNYSDLGLDVQVAAPTSPTAELRDLVDQP